MAVRTLRLVKSDRLLVVDCEEELREPCRNHQVEGNSVVFSLGQVDWLIIFEVHMEEDRICITGAGRARGPLEGLLLPSLTDPAYAVMPGYAHLLERPDTRSLAKRFLNFVFWYL